MSGDDRGAVRLIRLVRRGRTAAGRDTDRGPELDDVGRRVTLELAVGQIPSPDGVAMVDRVEWSRRAEECTWAQLGDRSTDD